MGFIFEFLGKDGILLGLEYMHGMMKKGNNGPLLRYHRVDLGIVFIRIGVIITREPKTTT